MYSQDCPQSHYICFFSNEIKSSILVINFICSVFNNAVSNASYRSIALNGRTIEELEISGRGLS
jgi:hypothetical protein